jgi:Lrp/AsnC family leucine-responsive transcriptional regulator
MGSMQVRPPGLDQLDETLDQFLAHGQTTTSIVQSTPVPARGLPLPGSVSGVLPTDLE